MLRPSSRTEARKKGFKKATDADEAAASARREIQIRKDKREEAMLKKRR